MKSDGLQRSSALQDALTRSLRLRIHRQHPGTTRATHRPTRRFTSTGDRDLRIWTLPQPTSPPTNPNPIHENPSLLTQHLDYLKLPYLQKHHVEIAQQSAQQQWDHVEYLRRLIEGEYPSAASASSNDASTPHGLPVLKTLEQFRWDSKKINRLQVQNLFA